MQVIEIEHLSYTYMPGSPFEQKALRDITFSIGRGELVGIMGHTGSGKSTLITHLNGLMPIQTGRIRVLGTDLGASDADLRALRSRVGLVFQYPEYQLFEETVKKDIAFGPKNLGLSEEETGERVSAAMRQTGISPALADVSPFELSGGQKRRVAIAGVLAMRPEILIMDEPAAGLDPEGREQMHDLIRSLHETGMTLIVVSHSMEEAAALCSRIIVLDHGRVSIDGTPAEIFGDPGRLRKAGLDLPYCVKIGAKLAENGIPLDRIPLSTEELAEAILKYAGKEKQGK